ncbi:MAG: carboxypeptidase regulatory-like domain-containing protein, partial [Planctomycetes bacterium]|nr:carboxypeptidase regulatory-like domain-containing protein [Planctomycetota bacterium]
KTAGYAILVEGRVQGNAGINSHNLTTNYVYKKLTERGLTEKDIYYFNYTTQGGVDEKPTKDGILKAITIWATARMNKSPAPLYIVFVGHGSEKKFFIYPESIAPGDLSDALNVLESQLNTEALKEPLVVVLGDNHSGSFVKALSKPDTNRIIIASADSKEVAYKGPLPSGGTIRQGDYFTAELFKYAAMGINLKNSCEKAAKEIAVFTKNENGNGLKGETAGNGRYFDKSAGGRDGARASNVILGNNTTGASLEWTKVTDVISLEAVDGPPTLFARVNDDKRVDKIWTEIASPGHSLPYHETATEQQIVNLSVFSYNYFDTTEGKYIWDDFSGEQIDNFREAGEYEVFYFARDIDTGDITTLKDSNVYRNAQGNQNPLPFNLIFPLDGATTPVALIFEWDDSADNDGDAVKYTLTISKGRSFDTIDYQLKDITASAVVVDMEAALGDDVTYYWRVMAIDARGGTTFMGRGEHTGKPFASELSPPSITASFFAEWFGFVSGYVYDVMMPNIKISGAKVTVDGTTINTSTTQAGFYIIPLLAGSYTLRASASGYGQGMGTVIVGGINESSLDIGLTSYPATVSGTVYIKLPQETSRAGRAIVGVHTDLNLLKNGQTIAKTTTKRDGSYTMQLNQGDYYMRAIKIIRSGTNAGTYKGFYNNSGYFHLVPGENKTGCDITIEK